MNKTLAYNSPMWKMQKLVFEVSMDELTNILNREKQWKHNCHLSLILQTHAHKANYLQWSSIRKKKWGNFKKLTSCQHADFSACLIEKSVISFISFEDREEAITV